MSVDDIKLDEPKPNQDYVLTSEDKFNRMLFRTIAITIISIVTIVGGCTAHSNSYDADRLSEKAKIVIEQTKASVAESEAAQAKIETMERMVKDGANPIAVRCMMNGWIDNSTCLVVGLKSNKELPNE